MTRRRRLEAATVGRLPYRLRVAVALSLVLALLPAALVAVAACALFDAARGVPAWLRAEGRVVRRLPGRVLASARLVADCWAPDAPAAAPSCPLPDGGLLPVYSDTPGAQEPAGTAVVPVRSWADCRCGVCRSMPAPCSCPCHEAVTV